VGYTKRCWQAQVQGRGWNSPGAHGSEAPRPLRRHCGDTETAPASGPTVRMWRPCWRPTRAFVVNKAAYKDKWKREKIENLVMMLQGALLARRMVGLKITWKRRTSRPSWPSSRHEEPHRRPPASGTGWTWIRSSRRGSPASSSPSSSAPGPGPGRIPAQQGDLLIYGRPGPSISRAASSTRGKP